MQPRRPWLRWAPMSDADKADLKKVTWQSSIRVRRLSGSGRNTSAS